MAVDQGSPRYGELYWFYHRHYGEWLVSQGQMVDPAAQNTYAHEQAANAWTAEHVPAVAEVEVAEVVAEDIAPVADVAPVAFATATTAPYEPVDPAYSAVTAPYPTGMVEDPFGAQQQTQPTAPLFDASGHPLGAVPAPPLPPKKKRMSKGALIGVIAGGTAVVLGAGAAGVFLIPPLFAGSGASTQSRLQDIPSEPTELWTAEFPGTDGEYVDTPHVLQATDTSFVVLSPFDYAAWSEDNVTYSTVQWYEGIEDDYQAGWDAGLSYVAAMDAWFDDDSFTLDFPEEADFYPAEFDGEEPWYYDAETHEHPGAFVGWLDAYTEDSFGASLPAEPAVVEDTSSIALYNNSDGKLIWSVNVLSVLEDADPSAWLSVVPTDNALVVVSSAFSSPEPSEGTSFIAALSYADGSVISEVEIEGAISTFNDVGSLLAIAVSDSEDGNGTVQILDPAALEKKSTFSVDYESRTWLYSLDGGILGIDLAGSGDTMKVLYFDVKTGEEMPWSGGRSVRMFGEELFLFDQGRGELASINAEGKENWSRDAARSTFVDGKLFVWNECDDELQCGGLNIVDPGSGELVWEKSLDNAHPIDIIDGNLLIGEQDGEGDYSSLSWVSVTTGAASDAKAPKLSGSISPFDILHAESFLYIDDADEGKLTAYPYFESADVWSYEYDAVSSTIASFGGNLYLVDRAAGEISLLGVK